MKRLFFAACSLLLLGACAVEEVDQDQDIGGAYVNGVFVAYCSAEVAPVIYSKNGLPMIDDHACIPEPEVLGEFVKLGGPDGPAEPILGPPSGCEGDDCPISPPPPSGCEGGDCPPPPPPPPPPSGCEGGDCPPPPPPPPPGGGSCENGRGNPGNGKCKGAVGEKPTDKGGWVPDPGVTGQSGNGGSGSSNARGGNPNANPNAGGGSKGFDHLSTAEQAFMLWDFNNRIDYEAYWQLLLDNGLAIAE